MRLFDDMNAYSSVERDKVVTEALAEFDTIVDAFVVALDELELQRTVVALSAVQLD